MSYPTYLLVDLLEINGQSCGQLTHRLEWIQGANPPRYEEIPGQGDFTIAEVTKCSLGNGQYTWKMVIRNRNPGYCYGLFFFTRSTPADDPTGEFCIDSSSGPNCAAGKASSVNDD